MAAEGGVLKQITGYVAVSFGLAALIANLFLMNKGAVSLSNLSSICASTTAAVVPSEVSCTAIGSTSQGALPTIASTCIYRDIHTVEEPVGGLYGYFGWKQNIDHTIEVIRVRSVPDGPQAIILAYGKSRSASFHDLLQLSIHKKGSFDWKFGELSKLAKLELFHRPSLFPERLELVGSDIYTTKLTKDICHGEIQQLHHCLRGLWIDNDNSALRLINEFCHDNNASFPTDGDSRFVVVLSKDGITEPSNCIPELKGRQSIFSKDRYKAGHVEIANLFGYKSLRGKYFWYDTQKEVNAAVEAKSSLDLDPEVWKGEYSWKRALLGTQLCNGSHPFLEIESNSNHRIIGYNWSGRFNLSREVMPTESDWNKLVDTERARKPSAAVLFVEQLPK